MALLAATPALFAAVAGLVGLAIGSFLNVVIHRLPLVLERQWRSQAAELEGRPVIVWRARVEDGRAAPVEVQPEGKRRMSYDEFLRDSGDRTAEYFRAALER